jgi:hypothetical protein
MLVLLGSTSGCCRRTFNAFCASCMKSLTVVFPHTFEFEIV